MRIVVKFTLLLVFAIGVPIAALEIKDHFDERDERAAGTNTAPATPAGARKPGAPGSHSVPSREPAAPDSVGGQSPAGPSGETTQVTEVPTPTVDPAPDGAPTEALPPVPEGQYLFLGELTGFGGGGRQELRLVTAGDTGRGDHGRACWSSPEGEFSFAVREEQFPLQLLSESGTLIYSRAVAPATRRVQLTAGPVRAAKFHQGLILPRALSTEVDEAGHCVVMVYGTTLLPNGSEIIIRLQNRGKETVQESLHVQAGDGVLSRLEGSTEVLFFGDYIVQLAWRPMSDPVARELLGSALPSPLPPGELPKRLIVRMSLGSKAAAKAQEREIQDYYERALEMCTDSRDLVLSVGKRIRGKRINRAELTRILKKKDAPPAARILVSGGAVSLKVWRRLIDEELPAAWAPFRDTGLVPFPRKYPGRLAQLQLAFSHLHDLAKLESQLVYRHLGRSMDPRDYIDPEFELPVLHRFTLDHLNNVIDGVADEL